MRYSALFILVIAGCSLPEDFSLQGDGQNTTLSDSVLTALESGSIDDINTVDELSSAVETVITNAQINNEEISEQLFDELSNNNLTVTWDPTHDSAVLEHTPGMNSAVLLTNDTGSSGEAYPVPLIIAGQKQQTPYMVMAGSPFRNINPEGSLVNDDMQDYLRQAINWLTGFPASQLTNVVIAQVDESYYFKDYSSTKNWLLDQFEGLTINDYQVCDDDALANCLNVQTQLLVISQLLLEQENLDSVMAAVNKAINQGTPVLYTHHNGNLTSLGGELFEYFNVQYVKDNYWSKLRVTNLSLQDQINFERAALKPIKNMLAQLENITWNVDLKTCDKNCSNQPEFYEHFLQGAQQVQNRLNRFDAKGVELFEQQGFELDKLLVLMADKYRQQVSYPMGINSTLEQPFIRALYSDYAQYQRREKAPVPNDLGNFSRTDFSHITPSNKTISMVSREPFRSAGVYALPGQKITITRTDDTNVTAKIFVNSIRDGATHEWDEDGYKRPKFLQGQSMVLVKGEPLTFVSTYGGPIHIDFSENDHNVTINFEKVGLHPYWNGPEDDTDFQMALEQGEFDWAELVTPAFEVHSKLEKMRDSASNSNWDQPALLAQATMTYTHNYPHVLAGFKGSNIDVVDEIHQFAENKGWTVNDLEKVKHMNADQATCGSGCSGNPYDAYWSFSPTGHGDIHELGHGLERGRFRFETKDGSTWEGHATTNPYSYYSKSKFAQNTGQPPSCQNLPFDTLYGHLQDAFNSGDVFTYMNDLNIKSWNLGVATYIQFMMAAQNHGSLQNGWHLWARLHIIDREFNRADNSEDDWEAKKVSLGMGGISYEQAKSLSNNDWMLMALSTVGEADYRAMFDMYGISYSTMASDQVNSLSLPMLPAQFYSDGTDYCLGLDKPALPVDGITAWPE